MSTTEGTAAGIESLVSSWRTEFLALDPNVAHAKPTPHQWSISEVLGHLVDSACNNHQRFIRAQHAAELTFPKYEQNEWVAAATYRQYDWPSLIELWAQYNRLIAHVIRHIPESQLKTACTITPYDTCSLEFLATDYLDHLEHHLTILRKRIDTQ